MPYLSDDEAVAKIGHLVSLGIIWRAFGGEGGAAGGHDGLELHELDAGAVGVVEVGLPFAVRSHGRAIVAWAEAIFAIKCGDGGFHVGDADGEVIHAAEISSIGLGREIRALTAHHVLDPVVAVGNLEGDPVDLVRLHCAVPVGAEAEQVSVELVFGGLAVDEIADMNDMGTNRLGRGGERGRFPRLNELNQVSFWIFDAEPVAAVGAGLDVAEVSNVVGLKVAMKSGCVRGGEGDAVLAAEGVVGGRGRTSTNWVALKE